MKKPYLTCLLVVGLALCFSITPIPINATTIINDFSGDANPNIHDILSISGGFDSSNLYFGATFQPGTFDPSNLGFLLGLDTDLSSLTGVQGGVVNGADFTIFFDTLRSNIYAGVLRISDNAFRGLVEVHTDTNSLSLTVPLSLLDDDDGVANFGLAVGTPVDEYNFQISDHVLIGGPTTSVPEPGILILLGISMASVVGLRRWWKD